MVRELRIERGMTTTNRLDNVIISQRRLMYFNVATTLAIFTSLGASIIAMF